MGLCRGVAFSIDKLTFERVLAEDHVKLAGIKLLEKVGLKDNQFHMLATLMVDEVFDSGATIMTKERKTKCAHYFVREGKGKLETDVGDVTIEPGGYFGEPTFRKDLHFCARAPYNVIALDRCVCGVLSLQDSQAVFDPMLLSAGDDDGGMRHSRFSCS